MHPAEPVVTPWQANLLLGFARRGDGTLLIRREHSGPLRVQKPLYPEGPGTCHAIVLHPPAGIAGGDELRIRGELGPGTHALLTTPGAGKWYGSAGPWAVQHLAFAVADDACLEWLPQETIAFDGARAAMETRVDLSGGARYLGWEILCLGRRARGERFDRGELRLETRISRDGVPLFLERGRLSGGDPLLNSPAGLAGYSVCGTLAATGAVAGEMLSECRSVAPPEPGAQWGVTAPPGLLLARFLGHSSEAARRWFADLWRVLRPALAGRPAMPPRIWNT